jgi:hypothetical protein
MEKNSDNKEDLIGANSLNRIIGLVCRFYRIVGGWTTYIVRGWYLDSNGCLKTYGHGYTESFYDESVYLINKRGTHETAR